MLLLECVQVKVLAARLRFCQGLEEHDCEGPWRICEALAELSCNELVRQVVMG